MEGEGGGGDAEDITRKTTEESDDTTAKPVRTSGASNIKKKATTHLTIGKTARRISMFVFGRRKTELGSGEVGEDAITAFTLRMKEKTMKTETLSLLERLSRHWYIENTSMMCSDVPRLVYRVTVKDADQQVLWTINSVKENSDDYFRTLDLIKLLVSHLEEKETADAIIESVEKAAVTQRTENEKVEDYLEKVFVLIGRTSRTYRILKCVHQDYVLMATNDLRLSLMSGMMTKDVRGDEGWQISITIGDYIQVIHTRKEQSVDLTGNDKNHFTFTYAVSMTFDKDMDEMTAARLNIVELITSPKMDPKYKTELEKKLGNGNLIVE